MRGYENASIHYCSHLRRNVIFENFYEDEPKDCICTGREQCGYKEFGCRSGGVKSIRNAEFEKQGYSSQ